MKEAPISLLDYFAADLALATNQAFVADKPIKFNDAEYVVDVSVKRSDSASETERRWQVVLDVRHQPGPETNFPYSYRVTLVGQFDVAQRVKAEDEERTVRIHGASVLYGMTREIVRGLTGRGPYRPVLLPTVSFYEQKTVTASEIPVAVEKPTAHALPEPQVKAKVRPPKGKAKA